MQTRTSQKWSWDVDDIEWCMYTYPIGESWSNWTPRLMRNREFINMGTMSQMSAIVRVTREMWEARVLIVYHSQVFLTLNGSLDRRLPHKWRCRRDWMSWIGSLPLSDRWPEMGANVWLQWMSRQPMGETRHECADYMSNRHNKCYLPITNCNLC